MKRSILCFILIISIYPFVLSQKKKPNKEIDKPTNSSKFRSWIDLGIGEFESCDAGGTGIGLSLNLTSGKRLYKIKFNSFEEPRVDAETPLEKLQEISGLYGRTLNYKFISTHAAVGIGAYKGVKRGERITSLNNQGAPKTYNPNHFTTIGLPIEVGIRISPMKYLGIGLYAEGNLTPHLPTFYYSIKLCIGKLR